MTDPEIKIRYGLQMSKPDWYSGEWQPVQTYLRLKDARIWAERNRKESARRGQTSTKYRVVIKVTGTAVVDDEDV